MAGVMLTGTPVFFRDETNALVLIEVDGRIVAKTTLSDWSKALAHPRIINDKVREFTR